MNSDRTLERHVVAWVDDDADYRTIVRRWLEPQYDVREYGDGRSFLSSIENDSPDAILLDVNIPGMDGFSICRRARERGIAAPILFLTSSNDQDDFLRHFELDATGYLLKPIGRGQLLSRLAELIDGERASAWKHRKVAAGWVPGLSGRRALRGTHEAK